MTGARPTADAAPHPIQIIVIAKAPVPGRVKTRLSPPCSPAQAAALAAAAIADTLDAVRAVAVRRRVVALDGDPTLLDLTGFDVLPQRGDGLGERLAAAFADAATGAGAGLPTLLLGMDTPQVDRALLTDASSALSAGTAVYGPAPDGGWWALGLPDPLEAHVLTDVPMSRDDTGRVTLAALAARGIRPALLRELMDVDTIDDARAVAAAAPDSRFARCLGDLSAAAG